MSLCFLSQNMTQKEPEKKCLDSSNCNHLFIKTGVGGVAPFESPVCFALNAWYCFDGMEQVQFLRWILDVHVDMEGVCLAVVGAALEKFFDKIMPVMCVYIGKLQVLSVI
jgi:hypothetical protein